MVISGSTRSRWLAVAVLGATLLAGLMLGFTVPRLLADETECEPGRRTGREHGDARGRTSIFDQLELTPAQQVRRDSILEKRRREMDAFWKEHGPEMRAIVDSTRAEFDRMLTPEQRVQMEAFREKRRRDREDDRRGEAPERGPGGDRRQP